MLKQKIGRARGFALVVTAMLSLVFAGTAGANPVTYTFSGVGDYVYNDGSSSSPFSDASFTFVFTGDTTAINTSDPPFFRYFNIGGTFASGTINQTLTSTNIIVASAAPNDLINFFNSTVDNGLGLFDIALSAYDLSTSIGPLTASAPNLTPTFGVGSFATTAGGFVQMTGNTSLTFSAAVSAVSQVPEPSTYLMMGTGLLGLLGYGWRRKKLSA